MVSAVCRAVVVARSPGVKKEMGRCGFKTDHGALHALAGCEAEQRGIELDLVALGAGEQGLDLGGLEDVGLQRTAQAGVDGEAGGQREGGRRRHADLGEIVEQRGVVFVDGAQGFFHLGHGLVEDGAQDAVLLIGKE